MTQERLLLLCGLSNEGGVHAMHIGMCERCVMLDGAESLKVYKQNIRIDAAQLHAAGVGDSSTVICHHDGTEVRYDPAETSIEQLAFLPWAGRVDFRAAVDLGYRWH